MSNVITLEDFQRESFQYYVYHRTHNAISRLSHYHDYYQVCFIAAGEFCHIQGSDAVTLHTGQAFIVPPGFVHKLHFSGEPPELYTLAFYETLLHSEFGQSKTFRFLADLRGHQEQTSIHLSLTPDVGQQKSILALFQCLLQQQDANIPREMSAVPALIGALVDILAQCYYRDPNCKRQPWNSGDNAQLMRRCVAYVNTNYANSLSADVLAKQFGLSRTNLCAAFRQHTGLPIHRYIAQRRIQRAQILIRSYPDLSLGQIARQVGYEDDSTFYRNFLKIVGVSPARFREL